MTSLGVWACQWRELRPISFGGRSIVPAANSESVIQDAVDDGDGYARGRGRGRGRDGSGAYEMVGLSEQADGHV
jgi:hypothetical protein